MQPPDPKSVVETKLVPPNSQAATTQTDTRPRPLAQTLQELAIELALNRLSPRGALEEALRLLYEQQQTPEVLVWQGFLFALERSLWPRWTRPFRKVRP